jgi:hypothetical protein
MLLGPSFTSVKLGYIVTGLAQSGLFRRFKEGYQGRSFRFSRIVSLRGMLVD